jgi:hypothetical protein
MLDDLAWVREMEPNLSVRSLVKVARCPEGERLYQAWMCALEQHSPGDIFAAIRAYFIHKNGTRNYVGKVLTPGCRECRFDFGGK